MTFQFRAAVRENTPIIIGVAGASGSGKTYTALELAMGMAGADGKIAVIDSEGRRALHYADLRDRGGGQLFRFDHGEWRAPFSPVACLEVLKAAEAAGYRVILVDSFSDEHEGEGGLIDMAAAGTNSNTAANWAKPKAQHKLIVRWLRQTRCHVIFCLRAEERVRLEKDEKGKTVVVPIGWWPVAEKRFMYDMTASFLLTPDAPGIPKPIKLQEQHRQFFPEGRPIARDSGRALAEWAAGGAAPVSTQRDTYAEATEAAGRGMAALKTFWNGLSRAERIEIRESMDGLKVAAAEADSEAEENPFMTEDREHTEPNLDAPFGDRGIEFTGAPPNSPAGAPRQDDPRKADDAAQQPAGGHDDLRIPLPPNADLDYVARSLLALIGEGHAEKRIRLANAAGLNRLREEAPALHDQVEAALAGAGQRQPTLV